MAKMKAGYKQTDIGIIPEDWGVDQIKNICQITTGDKNTQDRVDSGTYPFFVRSQNVERINSYSFDGEAVLTAGDGVGTGKIFHYINGKFDFHQRVYKMSHFNKRIDGFYFYKYFSNNFYARIMSMTAKSSVDSVRMEMIANMQVPLPKPEEQKQIAAALSDVDGLIESLEKLIIKKRDMKTATMQQLLTGKKRLPGFDGEWNVKRLGEIAFITKLAGFEYTNYFNSYLDEGNIIVIRGTNITNNKLDLSDVRTIPEATSKKLHRSKLQENDLVFAYVGTIGPVYLVRENDKFHLGPNTCRIVSNKSVSAQFLYAYFTSEHIRAEIALHTSIGAQPSLSMSKIRNFYIHLPDSYEEQTAIAAILSDMDTEIDALEQRLAKALSLKTGMMQELLTGKTRLIKTNKKQEAA